MSSHRADTPPEGRTRWSGALPAAVVLVALAARLALLGSKSLWADEAYVSGLTTLPLGEAMRLFSEGTPHPGGGLAFIWLSARIFGTSETGLRLLGAVLSASAALPLFLFLRRRTGARGAFCAALCWGLSPWSVSLGQEAWIYGPMASLAIWAVFSADLAWRGSLPALAGFVAACAAGSWIQPVFLLPAAAGLGLYFTLPGGARTGFARVASASAVILAAAVPVLLPMGAEMAGRSARMAAAGLAAFDLHRLFRGSLSVAAKLLPGGLLPDSWRLIASTPRYLAAFSASAAVGAASLAAAAGRPRDAGFLVWMTSVFTIPFLLFLVDDPTARQFPLAWLALACALAIGSSRVRWLGPASVIACTAMLAGYYGLDAFPYHRSDYRSAASSVDASFSPGDAVVLTGARSMTQAWSFYSGSDAEVFDTTGGNPYTAEEDSRASADPVALVDSLTGAGKRVWAVQDYWGGPRLDEILPSGIPVPQPAGSAILVVRVDPEQTPSN